MAHRGETAGRVAMEITSPEHTTGPPIPGSRSAMSARRNPPPGGTFGLRPRLPGEAEP